MARTPQDVTGAELAILQQLWERETATVRNLVDVLYPAGTPSDLATVQKLLKRLEDKGFVDRDRTVSPQVVQPALDRNELIRRRLEKTADALCGGQLTPLFQELVNSKRFTKEKSAVKSLINSI